MAKLTRGVLARDKHGSQWLLFYAGADVGDLFLMGGGWVRHTEGQHHNDLWVADEFREKYDLVYQVNGKDIGMRWSLPRPGQIVEDVWLEL